MNYYEHHLGDYAEATAHLSFVEDAAYSRCIRKYYAMELPLPADLKQVQRLIGARTKEEKEAVETVLVEFFTLCPDGWHNVRCDEEITKYQDKRSKAKSSANARWSAMRSDSEGNANASETDMRTHAKQDASALRAQCEGNALQSPVPSLQSPVPSPEEDLTSPSVDLLSHVEPERSTANGSKPKPNGKTPSEAIDRVFDHWRSTHNHPRSNLDKKRRKLIAEALHVYPEADLCQSISGYKNSPHHTGTNDTNTRYDDIELLLRDAKHIDAGLKFYAEPPRTDLSAQTRRIIDQTEDWVPPETRLRNARN